MVVVRKAKDGFIRRERHQYDKEKVGLAAAGLCVGFFIAALYASVGDNRDLPTEIRDRPAHPHIGELFHGDLPDKYNAIAQDVNEVLGCMQLMNLTASQNTDWGRRLDEAEFSQQHGDDGGFGDDKPSDPIHDSARGAWGGNSGAADTQKKGDDDDDMHGNEMADDFKAYADYEDTWIDISAKHLFCAAASQNPPPSITKNLKCEATGDKRQTLLDLWSSARAQITDSSQLLRFLELAKEQQSQNLLQMTYNLWAPAGDNGILYALNELNRENNADNGGIHGLQHALGEGRLFVDVGSGQGLTSMAVALLYPGTKIVSIEPAQPNWLMQEMNLRCNLSHEQFKKIHVVLGGVGHNNEDEDSLMAKFMWNPTTTTATRSWTEKSEYTDSHVELIVKLRQLKYLMAEGSVIGTSIDVLNLDCEGCEYNLVPQMSAAEFDAIPTVVGSLHWGLIPVKKLPSSQRAETTHRRLCMHENIAKISKECCAFPDMMLRSSVLGEAHENDGTFDAGKSISSAQVAGGLCADFHQWSRDKYLFDIKDDWGWFELTSGA